VQEHHTQQCRRCGTHLQVDDPEPLRHQVIEIPPITPLVIEHHLHRLICPCCGTSTCAELPAEVEPSPYGPRLSALVVLLSSYFPLSFGRTQALLDQLLWGGDQPRGHRHHSRAAERSPGAAGGAGDAGGSAASGDLRG
jgi:hypothetical protein